MWKDLDFEGTTLVYSWNSEGSILSLWHLLSVWALSPNCFQRLRWIQLPIDQILARGNLTINSAFPMTHCMYWKSVWTVWHEKRWFQIWKKVISKISNFHLFPSLWFSSLFLGTRVDYDCKSSAQGYYFSSSDVLVNLVCTKIFSLT